METLSYGWDGGRLFPIFPDNRVVQSMVEANMTYISGNKESEWTDAKNVRRVDLIKKKHAGGLTPDEHVELGGLQVEMLRFPQKIAPLPLEAARRLHQELLDQIIIETPPH